MWATFSPRAVNLEPGRSHDELFNGLAALRDVVEVERPLV
jgi:hypothetical protein